MTFEPIGYFASGGSYKYTVPRQGVLNPGHPGTVVLCEGRGLELAVRNLEGFERIWLIFHFHENSEWQPLVRPPILPPELNRVGLFASRSPYRPNPIGLSSVRLLAIDGLRLTIDEVDLIDGTPVLDIKPYIPKIDAFPDVACGWVERQQSDRWAVVSSTPFSEQAARILTWEGPELAAIADLQLRENPFDTSRKRVSVKGSAGVLSIRMFRIHFTIDMDTRLITLTSVTSGYTTEELAEGTPDPYEDKALHRRFVALIYNSLSI